jgi:hypothetical protein
MHTGKPPVDEKRRVIYRFCVTLMLYDLWNNMPIFEVARRYDVPRGYVQNLMSQAATQASINLRFCEELDEFWAFKQLFGVLIERLSHCCSAELVPLMALPAVKIVRPTQRRLVDLKIYILCCFRAALNNFTPPASKIWTALRRPRPTNCANPSNISICEWPSNWCRPPKCCCWKRWTRCASRRKMFWKS